MPNGPLITRYLLVGSVLIPARLGIPILSSKCWPLWALAIWFLRGQGVQSLSTGCLFGGNSLLNEVVENPFSCHLLNGK